MRKKQKVNWSWRLFWTGLVLVGVLACKTADDRYRSNMLKFCRDVKDDQDVDSIVVKTWSMMSVGGGPFVGKSVILLVGRRAASVEQCRMLAKLYIEKVRAPSYYDILDTVTVTYLVRRSTVRRCEYVFIGDKLQD